MLTKIIRSDYANGEKKKKRKKNKCEETEIKKVRKNKNLARKIPRQRDCENTDCIPCKSIRTLKLSTHNVSLNRIGW